MTIKNILVHVEAGPEGKRRVDIAVGLAALFQARLTGLTVVLPPSMGGIGGLPQLVADIEKSNKAYIRKARTLFERATAARSDDSEFRPHVGNVRTFLAEESAFADLVVAGETAGESTAEAILTADEALLVSAAPVFVIPHGYKAAFEPKTIFIAWKNSREAARAVRDAFPFLRAAAKVKVAAVAADAPRFVSDLDDLGAYLGRHGVRAEMQEVPGEGAVGRKIIELAHDAGADLIVAGGYGQTTLREWLMGGVSETLLHHSPIPCLMAH